MRAGACAGLILPCNIGLFFAVLLLAGCGAKLSFNQLPTAKPVSAELHGKSMGGQQPVVGSTIQLYAAGSSGYGTGAQAMLTPAVTTDQNGGFSIPAGAYTCPSSSAEMYMVATGGDPGIGSDNPAIALMAALGPCGDLTPTTFVTINEVTTVGSVWPLAQFLGPGGEAGATAANTQGLANAFANVNNIVNIGGGTSPGPNAPQGATIPTAEINTLANILATCVNGSSSACSSLFAAATPPSGTAPANTLDAALNIARNAANNVATLYGLQIPTAPFQPTLNRPPKDWTLPVFYSGGFDFSSLDELVYPGSLAVDAMGNLWIANNCWTQQPCESVNALSNTGQLFFGSTFTGGSSLYAQGGIAIDIHGNVWYTDLSTPAGINGGNGNLVKLSASGQNLSGADGYFAGLSGPVGVTPDASGNIWIADASEDAISEFSNSGTPIESGAAWQGAGTPAFGAFDSNGNGWFADFNSGQAQPTGLPGRVTQIDPTDGLEYQIGIEGSVPIGIATDAIGFDLVGHVWLADEGPVQNYGKITELELTRNGGQSIVLSQQTYSPVGLISPRGIAIDGAGNVWVTNFGSTTIASSVMELQGATGANPGQLIGNYGAGQFAANGEIALDASGNVWVLNATLSTLSAPLARVHGEIAVPNEQGYVIQILGVAAPVQTPLIGSVKPI